MLQLIQEKRLKEKFKQEFGLSVDDFVMESEPTNSKAKNEESKINEKYDQNETY